MGDFLFAKQIIYSCLDSYQDLDYLGSLMKNIDRENLLSTWLCLSDDINKWNEFSTNIKYPIQKLIFIAKNNNPDKYNDFIHNLCIIHYRLTDTSYDVSKVFYELYKYKYKYVSKNHWFIYDNQLNQWVLDADYIHLKRDVGSELRQIFIDKCFYYWKKMGGTSDINLKISYEHLGTIASKISLNLRKSSFINAVITESKCLFIDE